MGVTEILIGIDKEIEKLKQARVLLSGGTGTKRLPGRPKGSVNVAKPTKKKRNLSPEGRKRIQDAVKRRWAAQRKAASGK